MTQIVILTDFSGDMGFARTAGAYRIATELRLAGYEVQVIEHFADLAFKDLDLLKRLIDKFVDKDTLMVGISSTFLTYLGSAKAAKASKGLGFYGAASLGHPLPDFEMIEIFSWIKSNSPKCKIVMGGGKASHQYAIGVDVFVTGYADSSVIKLVKYLEGKNPFFQFKTRKRASGGTYMLVDDDQMASSFDFNHSQILWDKSDCINHGETLPIELSRGCIFRCKFCAYPLNGKKKLNYIKDPGVLREEFQRNYELYGTTHYTYADDTHNDTTQKLEMLYNEVYSKLPFKINFYTYIRLDLLAAHQEQIDLLKESGLRGAFFGIESLNFESAKAVGKGLRPEKTIETLHLLHEKWQPDISIQAGFIFGLPHDTEDSIRTWIKWLMSKDNPIDCVALYALDIKPNSSVPWKSEFEKNYIDYGYRFPDGAHGHRDQIWNNWYNIYTGLSRERVVEIRNEFLTQVPTRVASFGVPNYLNLGYDLKDLTSKSRKIAAPDTVRRKAAFIDRYYQRLLAS